MSSRIRYSSIYRYRPVRRLPYLLSVVIERRDHYCSLSESRIDIPLKYLQISEGLLRC